MSEHDKCWLGAYLYYAPPWESFLIQAIRPFIDKVTDHIAQFFFIRYWERGPHIRLRLKGERDVIHGVVKERLEHHFQGYYEGAPSIRKMSKRIVKKTERTRWFPNHSVQFFEYQPEVARYGGPAGILIAERQFEHSSRTVLDAITSTPTWTYEHALGTAVQMHLSFASALGMGLQETKDFYTFVSQAWLRRACQLMPSSDPGEQKKRVLRAFQDSFRQQQISLLPYFESLWTKLEERTVSKRSWLGGWIKGMEKVERELRSALAQGTLSLIKSAQNKSASAVLWPVLESYVHMTNNRLGVHNHDEAYLGYLIRRGLKNL